jgi:ATP-dependent helicase/nuclease subunit B
MSTDLSVTFPAIWLIPYAQLKATAREAWQAMGTGKPTPQITTVRDWATSLGVVAKASTDIHFDAGVDRLIAESHLKRAGLETAPALVQRLLDMAYEAAPTLAAKHPTNRVAWASQQAGLFQQGGQFQLEGAIGFAALMWAATTSFDTDVLWERRAALLESTEHFYVTTGLQQDTLVQAILDGASSKTTLIDLGGAVAPSNASIDEYTASNFEDLVQQTAAVILASHAKTVALIALDRQLTRRLRAVLSHRGVRLIDETGWALSTTTVAAQLMTWLEAMAIDATSDTVLAALKSAPKRFLSADVSSLEQKIRRDSRVAWSQAGSHMLGDWQMRFASPRSLTAWLQETKELLQDVGLWDGMQADLAGEAMLKALYVDTNFAMPMPQRGYLAWVRAVLEANRFRLKFDAKADSAGDDDRAAIVTVLPLAQMWGRHFDKVVVPSCDERRLPARPRQKSDWSATQREALMLPTADDAAAAQSKAWAWLCSQPKVSLLWQQIEGNEKLSKSSLLEVLEMDGRLRHQEAVLEHLVLLKALPVLDVFQQGVTIDWQTLAPTQLSASAYADLRACPYRFYATRILGLQDADELDEQVDKRDFGTWLHGTLFRFHEALKHDPALEREPLLVRCGHAEQKALGLDDAAFLPFALIWPKTREAYLAWLTKHEASGARYEAGEVKKSFPLMVETKTVNLVGTLDRIDKDDAASGGARWLLDYKTESLDKTKKRIKNAEEDTQLAFYAALVSNDIRQESQSDAPDAPLRAAYVNLVERASAKNGKDATSTNELMDLETRRDDLLDGIWSDLSNMAAGQALRALGEGDACMYCQVRGLCRKDFV